ncbi:hypothetical protein D3C73_1153740 [compost metagenome]
MQVKTAVEAQCLNHCGFIDSSRKEYLVTSSIHYLSMKGIAVWCEVSQYNQLVITIRTTEGSHHFQERVLRFRPGNDHRKFTRLNTIWCE